MNVRRILTIGLVLVHLEAGAGADDWVSTAAAARLWPVTEGGNGHTYQAIAVPELIPWTSADRAATLAGGYLATVTSQAENDFVYAAGVDLFVPAMGNLYGPWLGGYQMPGSAEPAGGWVWVTGEPFAYTAWCAGEPSQTAGPLNEDRLHYLAHGAPAPTWNDQVNALDFGPMAYVVEYDPVLLEAEDATSISGGHIEHAPDGYAGAGYVRLEGQANGTVGWTLNMGMAGPRALLLRYSNGTSRALPVQMLVNGIVVEPNLPCAPTGAWDAWGSATAHACFQTGENTVELRTRGDGSDLSVDRITLFGDDTNVVLNQCVACSGQAPAYPAGQAVDGDTQTGWRAEGLPQWLEVDLGDVYPVYRTQIVCPAWQVCQFRVEVKARAEDAYTPVVDRTGNAMPGTAVEPLIDTFAPTEARYVRLTVTGAAWGDPEITEFRVAAATGQAPAIAIGPVGYRTIQAALDAARPGDVITLQPGRYTGTGNESIIMKGKRVTLTSVDPNDSRIVAATVILGTEAAPAVSAVNREDAACVLAGLTISGAQAGLYCTNASPTLYHCRIVGNYGAGIELYSYTRPRIHHCVIAGNRGAGILMDPQLGRPGSRENYPEIVNCTIVENLGHGMKGGSPTVVNSIIYGNGAAVGVTQIDSPAPTVRYCDVQGGWPGEGNLDVGPCFARGGGWVDSGDPGLMVTPGGPDATWASGDYHLQSQAGRWDPQTGDWVVDGTTSPCIDAGDPALEVGAEPAPNRGRLNMGAYGGTREASMSP
jgi:hypothetical protein